MEDCAAEHDPSATSNNALEDQERDGKRQDLSQLMADATPLFQTASETPKTAEGDDAPKSHGENKTTSHHKQDVHRMGENFQISAGRTSRTPTDPESEPPELETVRNEEHKGGEFVIERRRSPRHSPFSGADALSPLLSEDELNIMKPIAPAPHMKGSGQFTNKMVHQDRSQEGSHSDVGGANSPSP